MFYQFKVYISHEPHILTLDIYVTIIMGFQFNNIIKVRFVFKFILYFNLTITRCGNLKITKIGHKFFFFKSFNLIKKAYLK